MSDEKKLSPEVTEALSHFDSAEASLRQSSAADYPESFVYKTLHRLRMGIAKLRGEYLAPKAEVTDVNAVPATKNRGDAVGPHPVPVPVAKVETPAQVLGMTQGWTAKYADGTVLEEADRTKFPPTSPSGAARVSIEKKK